ncbi:MAG: DUF2231 domain-containing protein [Chitinophagaceae bacterium]|nr:MAG: DUF2231 domain-containing protein [Chitinophagaceae bacterium]
MRILGHPVHPLLVHFPTALLPMEFALQALYRNTQDFSNYNASYYCLWGALIGGAGAVLTGLVDSFAVAREKRKALPTILYHAALNAIVLLAYALLLSKEASLFPNAYNGGGLWLRGILLALLFFGNYLGGKLIYHFGAGIKIQDHD